MTANTTTNTIQSKGERTNGATYGTGGFLWLWLNSSTVLPCRAAVISVAFDAPLFCRRRNAAAAAPHLLQRHQSCQAAARLLLLLLVASHSWSKRHFFLIVLSVSLALSDWASSICSHTWPKWFITFHWNAAEMLQCITLVRRRPTMSCRSHRGDGGGAWQQHGSAKCCCYSAQSYLTCRPAKRWMNEFTGLRTACKMFQHCIIRPTLAPMKMYMSF